MFRFTALLSTRTINKTKGFRGAKFCQHVKMIGADELLVHTALQNDIAKQFFAATRCLTTKRLIVVPLVKVVGEGFFGISEKLLPSRPEPLHSFFSVAVGAVVSMLSQISGPN